MNKKTTLILKIIIWSFVGLGIYFIIQTLFILFTIDIQIS